MFTRLDYLTPPCHPGMGELFGVFLLPRLVATVFLLRTTAVVHTVPYSSKNEYEESPPTTVPPLPPITTTPPYPRQSLSA